MKLETGKAYVQNDGTRVTIGGLAKCAPVEGLPVYWSIGGDWYTEDGRRVSTIDDGAYSLSTYPASNWRSIAREGDA